MNDDHGVLAAGNTEHILSGEPRPPLVLPPHLQRLAAPVLPPCCTCNLSSACTLSLTPTHAQPLLLPTLSPAVFRHAHRPARGHGQAAGHRGRRLKPTRATCCSLENPERAAA